MIRQTPTLNLMALSDEWRMASGEWREAGGGRQEAGGRRQEAGGNTFPIPNSQIEQV
ncbi:MAG: hypothetical protein ABIG63_15550 [Chloroflexota bacterium]